MENTNTNVNEQRDADICKMYVAGQTLEEIGSACGITRERVRQILKRAGYTKDDRPVEKSDRDEFLGVNVSEPVKDALRVEAAKRGVSMSAITSELLRDMLLECGYPLDAAKVVPDAVSSAPPGS